MGCPQNLVCGQTVDCGTKPAENEAADCYLQCLIHNTPPGGTLVLEPRRWLLEGLPDPLNSNPGNENEFRIPIRNPITIDFNGAELYFARMVGQEERKKGFLVVPDINDCHGFYDQEFPFVAFRNGRFIGDSSDVDEIPFNNFYGVIATTSENPLALKIGRMEVDSCVFKNLSAGVVFNSFSLGYIRQSVLTNNVFDNIVVSTDGDAERGRAATFNLPYQKPTECSSLSLGNVFRKCERHSLYVFSGGPFLSDGDKFIDGSLANVGTYPVAAVSLKGGTAADNDVTPYIPAKQGGDHMRISNGCFENCRVGITLSRGNPSPDAPTPFYDVSVSDCTFNDNDAARTDYRDMVLNNGDPAVVGVWRDIVVERTKHLHTNAQSRAISVQGFQNLVIRDVTIQLQQSGSASNDDGKVFIYAYGTTSRDLLIERVIASYQPTPPDHARLIWLDSGVTGTANGSPSVIIRDIATPSVPVYPVPTSPTPPVYGTGTNENIRIKVDPYFS